MRGRKPTAKIVAMPDKKFTTPRWPTSLMRKPVAQAFWKTTISKMQERGTWSTSWTQLVELAAQAAQDYSDMAATVEKYGLMIPAGSGSVKINPATVEKKAAWAALVKALAELGLTPTAASRFAQPGGADEFEEFMSNG